MFTLTDISPFKVNTSIGDLIRMMAYLARQDPIIYNTADRNIQHISTVTRALAHNSIFFARMKQKMFLITKIMYMNQYIRTIMSVINL